jgi:taurine---2-oxoglutarate transaminase
LGCIELVKNRATKEPVTPWNAKPADMEVTTKMAKKIQESGMFTFVRWNWIFVAPPLCVSKEEIDEGLGLLKKRLLLRMDIINRNVPNPSN